MSVLSSDSSDLKTESTASIESTRPARKCCFDEVQIELKKKLKLKKLQDALFKSLKEIMLSFILLASLFLYFNVFTNSSYNAQTHVFLKEFFERNFRVKSDLNTPVEKLKSIIEFDQRLEQGLAIYQTMAPTFFKKMIHDRSLSYFKLNATFVKIRAFLKNSDTFSDSFEGLPFAIPTRRRSRRQTNVSKLQSDSFCALPSYQISNSTLEYHLKELQEDDEDPDDLANMRETPGHLKTAEILLHKMPRGKSETLEFNEFMSCLNRNMSTDYIKYELTLLNVNLRVIANIKYKTYFFKSTAGKSKLSVNLLDLDDNFLLVFFNASMVSHSKNGQRVQLYRLVCLAAINLTIVVKLVDEAKRMRANLGFLARFFFRNIVSTLMLITLARVYVLELKMLLILRHFPSLYNWQPNQTDSYSKSPLYSSQLSLKHRLDDLIGLAKSQELCIGFVYVLCCMKILANSSFNEIISHTLITFRRCYKDLIGFFVVCSCLFVNYAIQFHYMLGAEFDEYSSFTKSFATLFRMMLGDFEYRQKIEYDWKAFYLISSYIIIMVILMFNLMLAIILGTYDEIKKDPTQRGSTLHLKEYLTILIEKYLPSLGRFLENKFNVQTYFSEFSLYDVKSYFLQHGYSADKVDGLFAKYRLDDASKQIDEFKIEQLIGDMLDDEYASKPVLRINNEQLSNEYVSEVEWKKLLAFYDHLEDYSLVFEDHLDDIYDQLSKRPSIKTPNAPSSV